MSTVVRTRRFWMLELSMLTLAAALFSVTLALIPLFTEKGLSYELAAWALASGLSSARGLNAMS